VIDVSLHAVERPLGREVAESTTGYRWNEG